VGIELYRRRRYFVWKKLGVGGRMAVVYWMLRLAGDSNAGQVDGCGIRAVDGALQLQDAVHEAKDP
jgi:hypothetical protein